MVSSPMKSSKVATVPCWSIDPCFFLSTKRPPWSAHCRYFSVPLIILWVLLLLWLLNDTAARLLTSCRMAYIGSCCNMRLHMLVKPPWWYAKTRRLQMSSRQQIETGICGMRRQRTGFEDKRVALPLDNTGDAPGPFHPKRYLNHFEPVLDAIN